MLKKDYKPSEDATVELANLLASWWMRVAAIEGFEQRVRAGGRDGKQTIASHLSESLDAMFSKAEASTRSARPQGDTLKDQTLTKLLLRSDADYYKQAIGLLLIVLHAQLDALVTDLLQLTRYFLQQRWKSRIQKSSVTFKLIAEHGPETLEGYAFDNELRQLANKPLKERIKALFEIAPKRRPHRRGMFLWDLERALVIDALRHEIAHSRVPWRRLKAVTKELGYLTQSGPFLIWHLAYNLGVEPSVEQMTNASIQLASADMVNSKEETYTFDDLDLTVGQFWHG